MSSDVFWQRDGLRAVYGPLPRHTARMEERAPSGRWHVVGPLTVALVDAEIDDLHDIAVLETACIDYWFEAWVCGRVTDPTPVGCRGSVRFNRDRRSNRRVNADGDVVHVGPPGWARDSETGAALCPPCKRNQPKRAPQPQEPL